MPRTKGALNIYGSSKDMAKRVKELENKLLGESIIDEQTAQADYKARSRRLEKAKSHKAGTYKPVIKDELEHEKIFTKAKNEVDNHQVKTDAVPAKMVQQGKTVLKINSPKPRPVIPDSPQHDGDYDFNWICGVRQCGYQSPHVRFDVCPKCGARQDWSE